MNNNTSQTFYNQLSTHFASFANGLPLKFLPISFCSIIINSHYQHQQTTHPHSPVHSKYISLFFLCSSFCFPLPPSLQTLPCSPLLFGWFSWSRRSSTPRFDHHQRDTQPNTQIHTSVLFPSRCCVWCVSSLAAFAAPPPFADSNRCRIGVHRDRPPTNRSPTAKSTQRVRAAQ